MTESHNGHRTAPVARIAAVGDLHCTVDSKGRLRELFTRASLEADVIALCGDLTDYGLPDEAHVLAGELAGARVPVVGVLGNHDHESGKQVRGRADPQRGGHEGARWRCRSARGDRLCGDQGLRGGFGIHSLGAWGEVATKAFVQTAIDEAMKLEAGWPGSERDRGVALLHYSPISGRSDGEPEQIYPFLGSSRLEDPHRPHEVSAVFHGHAHRGATEGRTRQGVPTYNVSLPLLLAGDPRGRPFRVVELPADADRLRTTSSRRFGHEPRAEV